MSIFKNETERLEYDYKCDVGIHHGLKTEEYKNFVEWLAVRASAPNTAYTKCLESLSKEIYGNDPSRDYSREEVVNLVRKHFA